MDEWLERAGLDSGIAVLSPHLDDAVLSCWHLLESRVAVTVVNVFTGSPPPGTPTPWWDRITGAVDPRERMRERHGEDRRALAQTGRTAVNLGFLDTQYRPDALPVAALVERLEAAVEPGRLVYAPAPLDRHPDHALLCSAGLELARAGRRLVLYADLPHAIRRGWPAWVTGEPEAPALDVGARWNQVLREFGLAVERLTPRVRPLDERARRRKLRALDAYRTQRAALDGLAFTALEDPRALAWEVSWEVPPSALRGADQPRGEPLVADAGREPPRDRA